MVAKGPKRVERGITELGPDHYRVVVSLGWDERAKRYPQATEVVHGTITAARRARARLLTEAKELKRKATSPTVREAVAHFIQTAVEDGAPASTLKAYRQRARLYIDPALGDTKLAELQVEEVDNCYRAMTARGLSSSTVRGAHRVLSGALNEAIRKRWIDLNVATLARKPAQRNKVAIRVPTFEEVGRLVMLASADDPEFATFLFIVAMAGARRGELCALRWPDVEGDVLWFRRGISDGDDGSVVRPARVPGPEHTLVESDTKTHAQRPVGVDEVTVRVLAIHHQRMIERAVAAGGAPLATDGFVFSDRPDGATPWNPSHVTSRFAALRKRAKLTHVRLHSLRHFSGSTMAAMGVPTVNTARRLGHSQIATTQRFYTHPLEAGDVMAAEVMSTTLAPLAAALLAAPIVAKD